jgi:3-phenylpropionate/trans-cinnamate dioxygenase ferredoxin component
VAAERHWIKVATTGDLEANTGFESDVEIDGETVGVFELDGSYYALGLCTHEQGPLSQGIIENGTVTCPWHSAVFDIRTGSCKSPPSACRVDGSVLSSTDIDHEVLPACTSYETKVEGGDILVRPRAAAQSKG